MPCSVSISQASSITPLVDPQPINVMSASRGPDNTGGGAAGLVPGNFSHSLFHHVAPFCWVREFVTDQNAVFVVFVAGCGVGVTGNTRNGARRDAACGDLVALVASVTTRSRGRWGGSNQLATINDRSEVQILRVHAEPAFRQQQIAKHDARALKPVRDIENLGDDLETISNIERGGDHTGIVSEGSAQNLPKIALLGLGWNTRGRTRTLAVDDHHWSLHHRREPETFAHQSKAAARGGAHRANARVGSTDRHIYHANLVLDLPDHYAG